MNVAELRKIRMLVHEATLALTSARAHWTFRRARRWMARLFMDDALKQLAEAETRLRILEHEVWNAELGEPRTEET